MQLKESRIRFLLIKTGTKYLESGIHGVESTIQNCLGFPKYGVESEKALLSSTYSYSPYEGRVPPLLIVWFKIMKVRYVNTGK